MAFPKNATMTDLGIWPQEMKFYLHSSKEDSWEYARELGMEGDEKFMDKFRYTGYEVEFDCTVEKDGTVLAHKVNGVELVEPIKLS